MGSSQKNLTRVPLTSFSVEWFRSWYVNPSLTSNPVEQLESNVREKEETSAGGAY